MSGLGAEPAFDSRVRVTYHVGAVPGQAADTSSIRLGIQLCVLGLLDQVLRAVVARCLVTPVRHTTPDVALAVVFVVTLTELAFLGAAARVHDVVLRTHAEAASRRDCDVMEWLASMSPWALSKRGCDCSLGLVWDGGCQMQMDSSTSPDG